MDINAIDRECRVIEAALPPATKRLIGETAALVEAAMPAGLQRLLLDAATAAVQLKLELCVPFHKRPGILR